MSTPTTSLIAAQLTGFLTSPWLRPLNDLDALDDLVGRIEASWSLTRIKARVIATHRETADVRTLVLCPNRLWPGHVAGQHVLVEAEIDGRRVRRTFTISSAPRADGNIAITVKRHAGGNLSAWWNVHAALGDVLTLSAPIGDFVLPASIPNRVVMLSAGSGITPVMALVRDLGQRAPATEVLFVHCARSRAEVIFRTELETLARTRRQFDLRLHLTADAGRLDAIAWTALAQTAGDDLAFVCGPSGFIDAASDAWRAAGNGDRLLSERFGLAASVVAGDGSASQAVHAERSGVSFVAGGGKTLLDEAEAAGLTPAYGCRQGICHTCKCRKLSGSVEDLRTGRVSDQPDEFIQLCVSTARSAVTLDI